jgi:microcin C transport system substrate-binding protein
LAVRISLLPVLVVAVVAAAACGGGSEQPQPAASSGTSAGAGGPVSTNKNDYPVFPNADAGADPSVPAEQGGKGFTGEGWETNTDFELMGDPRAVKGGVFRQAIRDFPATLRYIGPNLSVWNQTLSSLVYESLLGLDPITLRYVPVLATHWQVSPDKLTFRFRLDPNARYNDGTPVIAEDVVATWNLNVDKTVQDPFRNAEYSKFEQPVAESKYIVRVKAKEVTWLSLYMFSGMPIYPAHSLKGLTGAAYIKEYNDKMLPGSGAYAVAAADINKGNSIGIKRRRDYWAERYRRNIGTGNFDEIRQIVVRDQNLEFEMVKRGDIDFFFVQTAQMWVQELNFDRIQNGLMQKRKVWNHSPQSIQGKAINTRRKPYDDIRVRKALRHLYNRELMVEKMMFNEYVLLDSVFPVSIYENPNNEKIRFDPQKAVQLLAEAGWKDRNPRGQLVKDGVPLNLELLYYDRGFEKYYTIYQEDLRRVGINLNLRYVTPETAFKLLDEQQFDMFGVGYGGGGPFPLPSQFFDSAQADQKASTNVTGFKNQRVDEILSLYEREFDLNKRVALLRELDGIVTSQHHYMFDWTAPYERFLYWNKFGQPKGIITRIGDYRDAISLWWIDPEKNRQLEEALRDPSRKMEVGQTDDRYWLDFAKVEEQQQGSPAAR